MLLCGGEPTSAKVRDPAQKAARLSFTTTDLDESFSLFYSIIIDCFLVRRNFDH